MIFTTLAYAAFFAVVWAVHWLLPGRLRRPWLLAASYWFYLQAIPQYGILLALMTLVNYLGGLALGRLILALKGQGTDAAILALKGQGTDAAARTLAMPQRDRTRTTRDGIAKAAKSTSRVDNGKPGAANGRNSRRSRPVCVAGPGFHISGRRLLLASLIAANLGTLAFYKYANLLAGALWPLISRLPGTAAAAPNLGIVLPLGISFFTFEFIHYQVEVARGTPPIRSPVDFALFAAFFPTQIAGPIKRFPDWVKQIALPVRFRDLPADAALGLILRGAVKKIVVADTLAPLVAAGFARPDRLGFAATWIAVLAFTAQIYCDFAGYTDIGRGCAMLLGYSVPENFRSPYQARNPAEFWDRWHISLSRWLRDYLYIPLGGSRAAAWRVGLNLMITMALGGLWHGAAWHFMVWGVYQGVLLVGHRLWARGLAAWPFAGRLAATPTGVLAGRGATFVLVCLGWVIFRAPTPAITDALLRQALWPGRHNFLAGFDQLATSGNLALPLIILSVAALVVLRGWLADFLRSAWPSWARWTAGTAATLARLAPLTQPAGMLAALALIAVWPQGAPVRFIYFQF